MVKRYVVDETVGFFDALKPKNNLDSFNLIRSRVNFIKKLVTIFLCFNLLAAPCFALNTSMKTGALKASDDAYGMQAARILGIENKVKALVELKNKKNLSLSEREKLVALRDTVLRNILIGSIDTDVACEKLEREITFTYDLMRKEESHLEKADAVFTLITFLQFGTLYTLEPYSRLQGKFQRSAIMTGIASGFNIALPVMKIAYQRFHKLKNVEPKGATKKIVQGDDVRDIKLPPILERYLNTPFPGSKVTRRRHMYDIWQSRYGTDAMAKSAILSLLDNKSKSKNELYNRIVHLWSMYSYVRDFDYELLALLRIIKYESGNIETASIDLTKYGVSKGGAEMAKLLHLQSDVLLLQKLNGSSESSIEKRELQLKFLEKVLFASFEAKAVIARIKEEMNYSYDVVLAQLLESRRKKLQLTYDVNFVQAGTFGSIASLLYLQGKTKKGNLMFVIGPSSIGLSLTTLGLFLLRGGSMVSDRPPNSLAAFFKLDIPRQYYLSPFICNFLDSICPHSKEGLTHREELKRIWKVRKVTTVNLEKNKIKKMISNFGFTKDNIKIVSNRITLLDSLRIQIQLVHEQLYDLLLATHHHWTPSEKLVDSEIANLTATDTQTANLLDLGWQLKEIKRLKTAKPGSSELNDRYIEVTRGLTKAMLDSNKVSANLEVETVIEQTALDRLSRYRNLSVQLTNLLNFYQLGILGVVEDGFLGQTTDFKTNQAGNIVNIISGMSTATLGTLAFLLRRGGIRLKSPNANMLGPALNVESTGKEKYSPLLLKFLEAPDILSADKLTHKQVLMNYWKTANLLSIKDVTKPANAEKIAASGKHHHWWNENMKLLRNRVTMMHDLKSVLNLVDRNISSLAKKID